MNRFRPWITPIRIFNRQVSRSSGFRDQKYKRLDYPKAPGVLRDAPPEVRAKTQTPPESFQVKREGKSKDGIKNTTDEFTFANQKDALEFELAPSEVLKETLEKRLASLREQQKQLEEETAAGIARNGGVFAVRRGLVPGIYLYWDKVVKETAKMGTGTSEWKKMATVQEAQEWMGMYHVSPEDVCYDPFASQISFFEHLLSAEARLEPANKTWYAVKVGRRPGVYSNWENAADQVIGIPDAVYATFRTSKQACRYLGVTKKNYFHKLQQEPSETDKEMIRQRKLSDEQLQAYKRERDRVKFSEYAAAKVYVDAPVGGSISRVKELLTKCIQIQTEINKMVSLDKMRKFHMQDIFTEMSQMTKEEKNKCLASLDCSHLVNAFEVFSDQEYWDYYNNFLITKDGYRKGQMKTKAKEASGKDDSAETDASSSEEFFSSTQDLSEKAKPLTEEKESMKDNDEAFKTTTEEGYFVDEDVTTTTETKSASTAKSTTEDVYLDETSLPPPPPKKTTRGGRSQFRMFSFDQNDSKPSAKTLPIVKEVASDSDASSDTFTSPEATDTSDTTEDPFKSWLDDFSPSFKRNLTKEDIYTEDPFLKSSKKVRKLLIKEKFQEKVDIVEQTVDPDTIVTLDKLANITCNCGERVFVRTKKTSAAAPLMPLVPRSLTYLPPKHYPTLVGDLGWTAHTFKMKKADFDANTTSFKESHDHDNVMFRAFEANWRVLFNSVSKRLAPIAANHAGRFEDVEANVVYTDGSFAYLRSPVEGFGHNAGWGVHFPDGLLPDAYGRVPGEQTAQRAEILAMIMAIRIISRDPIYRNEKWEIRTDHLWTLRLLENGWDGLEPTQKMRSHANYYLLKRLRALLYENQNISVRHIKNPHMHAGSRIADKMAKKGTHVKYTQSAEKYGTDDEDVVNLDPALRINFPEVTVPTHARSQENMWDQK
ncbi:hypothetical protein CJU90_2148 [Yarrowia sp. C11]|nr:hypothetical protein CJU90_2148 [Yarrowia sp. C11]